MLSKVASAYALIMIGAQATESEWQREQPIYRQAPGPVYRQAPGPIYREAAPQVHYGFRGDEVVGRRAALPAPPRGYIYSRRGTINPLGTSARHVNAIDSYYETAPKVTETIKASCEFDFLGYSHSEGRIELEQKPGDNTSLLGQFEGIHEGIHALKVHELGDLEYGCESTGDVFNPYGAKQGNHHVDIMDRRLGDLEQVQARMDYTAEYKNRDALVMLSGPDSIVGRSIVLYERKDDHDVIERPATQYRDAIVRKGMGRKIACCVVGLAEGDKKPEPKPAAKPAPKFKPTAPNSIPEPLRLRHQVKEVRPAPAAPQLPQYRAIPQRRIPEQPRAPVYRPQYNGAW